MARHVGSVKGSVTAPVVYQGTCTCSATGPLTGSRADADYWVDHHLAEAARAQAHRITRQPTLQDQADWYRAKQAQATDPDEIALWDHLADELEHRLGTAHPIDTPPLF